MPGLPSGLTRLLSPGPSFDWHRYRQRRIRREGSPYYPYEVPSIAAGVDHGRYVGDALPLSRKYAPLDWLEIVNNDVVNLTLTINAVHQAGENLPVPAGSIRTIENQSIYYFNVHNDDAAVASTQGLINISLRRKPVDMDSLARERQ